jgi:hypothetical protein
MPFEELAAGSRIGVPAGRLAVLAALAAAATFVVVRRRSASAPARARPASA